MTAADTWVLIQGERSTVLCLLTRPLELQMKVQKDQAFAAADDLCSQGMRVGNEREGGLELGGTSHLGQLAQVKRWTSSRKVVFLDFVSKRVPADLQ